MSTSDLSSVPLGERVTVRHRLPDGRATDAVGVLSARDETSVTLQTRRGQVRVLLASVVVHRRVRPAPWRIDTFLRGAGVAVLGHDGLLLTDGGDGTPSAVATLVDALRGSGVPVVVLADGSGRGPQALARAGLEGVVPLLLEVAAPSDLAPDYAAVHGGVEQRLGRELARPQVRLTDDRPDRVAAARAAGWQARIFTPPA
ncbi:hypothetical protein [Ornithinimicrobium pekingense]|uniref:Histone acetyltransferase Rv0428c-like SH3 domain-containing protein n=1 Tax=Ornithinimicrobium pekingense TaxID=384677 RepID=A0ABQ2F3Q6_9MICO|nr:hypothetical protein [Ornithinimicrobium pekingense]GGK56392.1 hypothetical protein GCM10011509_00970 [Ornithinimicrobium pekingense]